MLGLLYEIWSNVIGFLTGVLPQSPFGDLTLNEEVQNYLGWLNWLVPIGDMLALFSVVLALFVVAKAAMFVVDKGIDLTDYIKGD